MEIFQGLGSQAAVVVGFVSTAAEILVGFLFLRTFKIIRRREYARLKATEAEHQRCQPECIQYLKKVERLAETESRYLNDHHPESEYSSKAASAHGNIGLFQMTAQRARKLTRIRPPMHSQNPPSGRDPQVLQRNSAKSA